MKDRIPNILREEVWFKYMGDHCYGICLCCNKRRISAFYFHCGHIISEHHGGDTKIDNLVPLCGQCNNSMYTKNLFDFMQVLGLSTDRITRINILNQGNEPKTEQKIETKLGIEQKAEKKHDTMTQDTIRHTTSMTPGDEPCVMWCQTKNARAGDRKKYGPYGSRGYFKYKWSCCPSQAENPTHHVTVREN